MSNINNMSPLVLHKNATWRTGAKVKGLYCNVGFSGVITGFHEYRGFCNWEIDLDKEIVVFGEKRQSIIMNSPTENTYAVLTECP